jgi:adenylate cyclase
VADAKTVIDMGNVDPNQNSPGRLSDRTDEVFAEQERLGLMLAAKARIIALLVILLWQIVDSAYGGIAYAYVLMSVAAFAGLGLVQYLSAKHRFYMSVLKYVFVLVDCVLLAMFLTAGNPFVDYDMPPTFPMRGSQFALFFILLMQVSFSFRPRLVIWCGLCVVATRTGMLLWTINRPGVFTNIDLPELSARALAQASLDPGFVHLGHWFTEVMVSLIVAGGFAVVVGRSRSLVEIRSMAERQRANLARYFSPNVVDRLAGSQIPLDAVREQNVAILFADIMGFTRLCESAAPASVIALLRDYHNRLGHAVFNNGGTLDKYIGDGLMATFGTPEPGSDDAKDALKCALDMIAALEVWNAERAAEGLGPVHVGIGLHYGPVVAGDIGNERRLEYSVIGDAVNIASRIEHLTRTLDAPLVVSDDLVCAIDVGGKDAAKMLENLSKAGVQEIRGRDGGITVWKL